MGLPAIKAKAKTGNEQLSDDGRQLPFSVLDFWKWSASDLISNATRGRFAEFIIASAIGANLQKVRDEWDAFDLQTSTGIKIEVKSSGFIQSWPQKDLSVPTFSIAKTKEYDYGLFEWSKKKKRQADVYVFCLFKHKIQSTASPLQLEQWEFYVVPTITLDKLLKNHDSIGLSSLHKLSDSLEYADLNAAIERTVV